MEIELKPLIDSLIGLKARINANKYALRVFKNWQPDIVFEIKNSGECYLVKITNGFIGEINQGVFSSENRVLLRGESKTMRDIFEGTTSPAKAFFKGSLEIYGTDKDQSKLDALSLVMWDD